MSLKFKIPVALSAIFMINIFLLFLFIFFHTVPDLKEGVERFQREAESDIDKIVADLTDKSYNETLILLQGKMVENPQLSFVLENIATKERISISEQRWGELYFSAVRSINLSDGIYVLMLRSDINVYYSLDGTLFRLTLIEGFVLFVSFAIIAGIMHVKYVTPLKHLTTSIEQFHKTESIQVHKERKDEIGSLDKSFYRLASELRAEKENQNRIIASISHDIKTPLTSVMGFTERLLNKDLDKDKQIFYLKSIYRQGKNIEDIVNDFDEYLSYSCSTNLTFQKLNISFIKELLDDEYTEICASQGAALTFSNRCPQELSVDIDGARMRRVFSNLIGNAMRHNDNEDLEINVAFEKFSDVVRITVSDNGKGVSEAEIEHIFEPFYTTDKSRKMSGLGLSICAQITKLHGGNICAYNTGGGFAVQISLPAI